MKYWIALSENRKSHALKQVKGIATQSAAITLCGNVSVRAGEYIINGDERVSPEKATSSPTCKTCARIIRERELEH